jgi:hypothetical protein
MGGAGLEARPGPTSFSSVLLEVAASEEPKQREDENDDQDDP